MQDIMIICPMKTTNIFLTFCSKVKNTINDANIEQMTAYCADCLSFFSFSMAFTNQINCEIHLLNLAKTSFHNCHKYQLQQT